MEPTTGLRKESSMNLRNSIFATAFATAILASTALGGAAQTASSSVTITSGTFSASLSATNFGNLPYSLNDQYARNGSIALNVTDLTGDGGGWQVTVDVTDFVGQTRAAEVIPVENLELSGDYSIVTTDDNSQPVSMANMPLVPGVVGGPEIVWVAQPGFGQGSYVLRMTADLLVEGRTTAQTYTSTGTVAIVAGP